jgi:sugar/nucleoside kinase (ribokinase family)
MSPKLLVIGDVIDDIIVVPEHAIRPNTDTNARIEKTLGGSAANVAAWAASGGASVQFIGCVGRDDLARNESNFATAGVSAHLQVSDRATGSIVVLVDGDSRSMLTDRGANQDLNLDAIEAELADAKVVYLSGYALLGKSVESVLGLIERAHGYGALVAVDPGSTGYIEDYGVERYRELLKHVDVCFPNLEEAELLRLEGQLPLLVITDGERGATAQLGDGEELRASGLTVDSVDPTGAGDAFCGAFLAEFAELGAGLNDSAAIQRALDAGIVAGAKAVTTLGARPSL